eukprot:scaffold442_cov397-Prasinococcus_capsulatus_cf.AAC.32
MLRFWLRALSVVKSGRSPSKPPSTGLLPQGHTHQEGLGLVRVLTTSNLGGHLRIPSGEL